MLGERILCNIVCNNSGAGRLIIIARNMVRNNVGLGRQDVIAPTLHRNMVCNNVGPVGGGVSLLSCKYWKHARARRRRKRLGSAALADDKTIVHETRTLPSRPPEECGQGTRGTSWVGEGIIAAILCAISEVWGQ